MMTTKILFAALFCFITLVSCNALTGKEVARVTFTRLPDPENPRFQYATLTLANGQKIQFWSDMDLEYDDFQVIEFYVQLPVDMNLPPIRLNALQKDITIGETRTVIGNHVSWRFTGRIGSFEAPAAGTYKFSTLLNPSLNPTLQLKKAALVFKE